MSMWLLMSMSVVGCPWTSPVAVYYSDCVPMYLPCAPVYRTVECAPAVVECIPTPPAAPAVAEVASEEALVTEAVGLQYPSHLALEHLALDWGAASLASGTLFPTQGVSSSYGGFPFPGTSSSGGGFQGVPATTSQSEGQGQNQNQSVVVYPPAVVVNTPPITVVVPPSPNPQPVPEPASVATWLVGSLVGGSLLRRRYGKSA